MQEPYFTEHLSFSVAASASGTKTFGRFIMHVTIAVGVLIPGMMFAAGIGRLLGRTDTFSRLLSDIPYSPLLWGTALLIGFVLNKRLRHHSACWTWLPGLCWLAIGILGTVSGHDPRWCEGCAVSQDVWRNLFTVNLDYCLQECLGELFVTTPSLTCIAYSIGAFIAILSIPAGCLPAAAETLVDQ